AVEAAATGGMALMAHAVATRALRRGTLKAMLHETMAITGALFALLVAATVFTLVQRAFGTDRWLAATFASMGGRTTAVLALGLAAVALCALVLDAFEMIFVVIPLIAPALLVAAPDAPWVSVLILLILQASFLIPPFGYAVLMARSRTGSHAATGALVRALAPFVAAQLTVLAIVLLAPGILWRESPTLTPASTQPQLSDEKVREMLDEQLKGVDEERK
ncbi:MAG TPA: TRAP transporter large permease subunit, partial [Usitatibacter sp.]|nr:TRAP transporter large permease subunit [Usitatibacter sp.]